MTILALGAVMASGATLVLQETFEPGAALQCLVDERANATQCWPHQAKAMAEAMGKITLALRSSVDLDPSTTIGTDGITLAQLRTHVRPTASPVFPLVRAGSKPICYARVLLLSRASPDAARPKK